MAEKDQSAWLPEPPPPRPARRDSAIETALRKFDGAEDAAPSVSERPRRSWVGAHRPQFAVLVSAMLLVIVGVPAALIGLRNAPAPQPSQTAPPKVRYSESDERAQPLPPAHAPGPPPTAQLTPSTSRPLSAPPTSKYTSDDLGLPSGNEAPRKVAEETTVNQMLPAAPMSAAAPPPPSPPPPPPPLPPAPQAVAEADQVSGAARSENIIVTGSRVAKPARTAPIEMQSKAVSNQGYPAFLSRLQGAVKANDHRAVIGMIAFPLRVNGEGGPRIYRDAASVQRDFDRIFTPKVRRAILEQRGDKLFMRDIGAMVGDGELWFSESRANSNCSRAGPVRIIAVNR
jgi:hypothetical protein